MHPPPGYICSPWLLATEALQTDRFPALSLSPKCLLLLLLKWLLLPGELVNLSSSRLGPLPGCSALQGSDCRLWSGQSG